MISRIYTLIRTSKVALTTREICCALNNVSRDYCLNVDGRGSRCIYWYRRPKHEKQRIRLVKPNCRFNPLRLYKYLKLLVENNLIKRAELYLRDPLSSWGRDRHVLYYVDEDQLHLRLKTKPL